MKCSRCGTSSMSRSHRHGMEKNLTAVIPMRPYRCAQCRRRKWQWVPWEEARQQYVICAVASFCLVALVAGIVLAMRNDTVNDFARHQANVAPQAAPGQALEAPPANPKKEAVTATQKSAVPPPARAGHTSILSVMHSNGMRLTMPAASEP